MSEEDDIPMPPPPRMVTPAVPLFPVHRVPDLVTTPHPHGTTAAEVIRQAHLVSNVAARGDDPRTQTKPWGSPMYEPVPDPSPAPRPDGENAWGRSEQITGPNQSEGPELARVILPVLSESLTIMIDADPATPPGIVACEVGGTEVLVPLTVWALIAIGSGSTNYKYKVRVDSHLDIPVVGLYVSVKVFIADLFGNVKLPGPLVPGAQLPTVQVYCQLSRQVRGLPSRATRFLTAFGTEGNIVPRPCRINSITAHLATPGAEAFLQLFDQTGNVPEVGAAPYMEFALGTAPELSDIGSIALFLNTLGFSQGLTYGVSSTSGSFHGSGQDAWVGIELVEL